MSTSDWRVLGGIDRARLHEARLQAHYAVQWLARAARAYVAPRPNDEHTSLGWDDVRGELTTHPWAGGGALALQLATLKLVISGPARARELALDGCSEDDVRAWLGRQSSAQGLDPRALDAPSPYEMPTHAIASGGRYDTMGLAEALGELAAWYVNAVHALKCTRQKFLGRYPNMPEVRCWPHHFDFDTQISLGAAGTEPAGSVGAGFSPGDDYYDEPYIYVTLHPAPDVTKLPRLPAIGHWHTQDFTAAVAPASRILAAPDRQSEVDVFLASAIEAAVAALSPRGRRPTEAPR